MALVTRGLQLDAPALGAASSLPHESMTLGSDTLGICAAKHFEVTIVEELKGSLVARVEPSSPRVECPITGEAMRKPVMTSDGHVYEEEAIQRWFDQGRRTSPLTNLELPNTSLQPLQQFAGSVQSFLAQRPEVQTMATLALRELPRAQGEAHRLRHQFANLEEACNATQDRPSKRLRTALETAHETQATESESILRDELRLAEEELSALSEVVELARAALGLPRKQKRRIRSTRTYVHKAPSVHIEYTPARLQEESENSLHVSAMVPNLAVPTHPDRGAIREDALANLSSAVSYCHQVVTEKLGVAEVQAAKARLALALCDARQAGVSETHLCGGERVRRRAHNMVEDMKGAIRVFCRVRPLSCKERNQSEESVVKADDSTTVNINGTRFFLDAVFVPEDTAFAAGGKQDDVFEDCRDLVQSAMDGYNATLFAYGQTGAGKTYTTYGTPDNPGLAPRMVNEIFRIVERDAGHMQFSVRVSMLELYRNDLSDLLQSDRISARKVQIRIRSGSGETYFDNLEEKECSSAEELSELVEHGKSVRRVRHTAMNSESSRSHLIMILKIHGHNKHTQEELRGKITLCDLAGSERLSKSQVTGDGAKEAIEINKSLTALGDVLESLTKGAKQIPYRNHKLTQLMQDSLGGQSKTLMFVTCSPSMSNEPETMMSLKWATRAKQITKKSA